MVNKDIIAGKVKEVGGAARKNIGKLTGDREAEARGRADQATGAVQKNFGKLKDAID